MHTIKTTLTILALGLFVILAVSDLEAVIIYVDADASGDNNGSSWEHAYNNPQGALAAALSGDEIWVAEGTYMPDGGYKPVDGPHVVGSGNREATFPLINGVVLYGGFVGDEDPGTFNLDDRDFVADETILSGDLNGDDNTGGNNNENSYHVTTGSSTDSTTVLDGFTITAGNADGSDPRSRGGGMYNDNGSPTITNCTFRGNSANYDGGGMYNRENSSPTLTDCTFSGNSAGEAGGMLNRDNSSPTLTNCTFSGNSAKYRCGGMYNSRFSNPTLTNCTFSGNSAKSGGGMYNYDSDPTMINCTFSGNSASGHDGGGGMFNGTYSEPTLTNCTFSGNSSRHDGGGMFNTNSSPMLTNCTFAGNSAERYGGGMFNYIYYNPTLTNCTISGNSAGTGGGMFNLSNNSPTLTNCTISENSASYQGGGMYNTYSSPTLTNCTISGNTAGHLYYGGGGMYNSNSSLMLTNCTISGNSAWARGGGIYNYKSNLMLTNSILWGNTAPSGSQIYNYMSSVAITYSDIQGGWSGEGNIDDDPLFVRNPDDGGDGWGDDLSTPDIDEGANDDYGDLHLQPGSPCIDAANNIAIPLDSLDLDDDGDIAERIPIDLDGNQRCADDPLTNDTGVPDLPDYPYVVDMGAYEFQRGCVDTEPPVITCPPSQTVLADENCEGTVPDLCILAVITDDCDQEVNCDQDPPAGAKIPLGDTIVKLTTTDDAGNTGTCEVTVTVIEDVPPEITCPSDQTVLGDNNWEGQVPDLCSLATITDNCDPAPMCEQDPPTGATIPAGDTLVTLTATDQDGNTNTCTVTITVIVPLNLDIKPDSCPSPLNMNTNNKGRIKFALLGSDKYDVNEIDINSIAIAGVVFPPKTPTTMDVGTPRPDSQECECRGHKKDGINDLLIYFPRKEIILALGLNTMERKTVVPVTVEGALQDGTLFQATDCVKLVGRKD
ncbi:MAG: right-handed parallel beta-helix repeat-containing protein [Planctomycetota bacterium]|jgi:parallel beta-helix repeat protein